MSTFCFHQSVVKLHSRKNPAGSPRQFSFKGPFLAALLLVQVAPSSLFAQSSTSSSSSSSVSTVTSDTLSVEGIVGDVDKGRRAPVVTFSTAVAADDSSATILADTQVINEDFRKYPISVEFF